MISTDSFKLLYEKGRLTIYAKQPKEADGQTTVSVSVCGNRVPEIMRRLENFKGKGAMGFADHFLWGVWLGLLQESEVHTLQSDMDRFRRGLLEVKEALGDNSIEMGPLLQRLYGIIGGIDFEPGKGGTFTRVVAQGDDIATLELCRNFCNSYIRRHADPSGQNAARWIRSRIQRAIRQLKERS